jgi:phosphate transport system substrate-binding protein
MKTAILAGFIVLLAGCGGSKNDVKIDGSSTVFPITEVVAVAFREVHPKVRVSIGQGGTGTGMAKFTRGEIDICDASRKIKPSEVKDCQDAGIRFVEFPVAYDGIAVVVNSANDWCQTLTVQQLKELWRADSPIKKWSDLDASWPDEEIKLFGPGHYSGTYEYFNEVIIGDEGTSRDDYSPNEDDNLLVSGVKNDEYALAYFGYSYYDTNKDVLNLVAIDNGDGNPIKPSTETVRENIYKPLSRPLFIYVRVDALEKPGVKPFVEYYLNNAARLAESVAYVRLDDEKKQKNLAKFAELTADTSK